ncbi:uncharacterized protein LOC127516243 isoform X1 [Ctenopharyngodon idella]|uniref:uncharacterized protein LOC127516243 isoform X1 n=1 Tax=Ctenopharyngodon idella TaxID=7959 RepID=UPI002231786F|nr:uncharacterized protein LOC127516243 isoform X1 [Ctenopharyngodon idella]
MESYLCCNLSTAPLSAAAQSIIAALRVQYAHRGERNGATLTSRGFRLSQHQGRDDRNQELYGDLDLNNLAEDSNHFKLRDVTSNESVESLQIRPDVMTEAEIHKLTFGKRKWIQPASPTGKGPVCCNQHEAPPVKKISFSQLTLLTNNCHPASEEECKRINIVDNQSKNGQINQFWSCQSGLTEKDNGDSVCEETSKEARAAKAVFIQVQHNTFISNAEKPTSKYKDLETSHCWQDSRNSELSAPVESCAHAKRCGSISLLERVQDTPVRSGEILDSEREKEDSDSERQDITKSRTGSPQPDENTILMPVEERTGKMESTVHHTSGGVQHSIQPHSQAGEVKSFLKHIGKWEPSGPLQEAPKITSSQELCKNTLRNPTVLHAKVKGSVQLLKQPKAPRPGVKRQRHPLRRQKESKSQGCNKPNNFKHLKPSDPSLSGSKISYQMSSETDRKEDGNTTTFRGAFSLISDPRVCDTGRLSQEDREFMLEEVGKAKALVVTMVYQDGTIQLDPEQKLYPAVCGLLVLLKTDLDSEGLQDRPPERVLFLKLEQTPAWAQQDFTQKQDAFTRELLLQMMCGTKPFVCFKAKDLLRTALRHFSRDLSWKQVLGCQVMDPQIAAWLLDPGDSASCFQTLLSKHYRHPVMPTLQPVLGQAKVTQAISNLALLHKLMVELQNKLQTRGLWQLYSGIEQKMIPVLAGLSKQILEITK